MLMCIWAKGMRLLLLLEDGLERLGRRSPHALGLLQAEVVQGRAHGDDHVAAEGVVGLSDRERVALGEGGLGRGLNGGGDLGGDGVGSGLLGAHRHRKFNADETLSIGKKL